MAVTERVLATAKVDTGEVHLLTKQLIDNSIGDESSSFNMIRKMLKEELSQATGIDEVQKVGIYSNFLKDAYTDVNKQALGMAYEILKGNEELALATLKTQAEYNHTMQQISTAARQEIGIDKDNALKTQDLINKTAQLAKLQADTAEVRAKIKKQYGVTETATYTLSGVGEDDATLWFRPYVTASSSEVQYFQVNAAGELLANQAAVTEYNDDEATEATVVLGTYRVTDHYEYKEWTTDAESGDAYGWALRAQSTISSVSSTMNSTADKGAIDKQIEGYDKVNQKDSLKAMNELMGMMVNAQIDIPCWMPATTKELVKVINSDESSVQDKVNANYKFTPADEETKTPAKCAECTDAQVTAKECQ